MRIIIVGAGIAGLSTALSLEAAGLRDVQIYERADEVRGLGVGINLLPHAMREITELGLAESIWGIGVEPSTLSYFNRHGQPIWSEPRGTRAGYEWPQMSVHRGRLQLLLRDAVLDRLGDVIHLDHRLVSTTNGLVVTALFQTSEGEQEVTADLLIAADGIHSAARALRYRDEGGPHWGGLTLWRGTTYVRPFLDGKTMIMVGDGDQKFVAYPLTPPGEDGLQRVNFIAEKRGGGTAEVDWNRRINPGPIAHSFAEWQFDWLDIPAAISNAEEILEYPMVDRDALPQWTFGATTLVGDAAHAMYPNGSNGGSQAILDARTLAFHLATAESISTALELYEQDRRPATARLLELTRQTGPERVMLLAHERAPGGFGNITDIIPAEELAAIAAEYKRAAGFHPDALNARSSLNAQVRS